MARPGASRLNAGFSRLAIVPVRFAICEKLRPTSACLKLRRGNPCGERGEAARRERRGRGAPVYPDGRMARDRLRGEYPGGLSRQVGCRGRLRCLRDLDRLCDLTVTIRDEMPKTALAASFGGVTGANLGLFLTP